MAINIKLTTPLKRKNKNLAPFGIARFPVMERVMGIEPTTTAWKAVVLPLNYTRILNCL